MKYRKPAYRPYGGNTVPLWLKIGIAVLAVGLVFFVILECILVVGARTHIEGEPKTMLILGCQVKADGPSVLLLDRLDTALDYLAGREDVTIVVSGGQGAEEPTTEALAMRDYLVEHGIAQERILMEEESHSTYENMVYSFAQMEAAGLDTKAPYIIVSNGFHLSRAVMLANRVDQGAQTYTLAAPTSHTQSRITMYFREPLALVKSFVFDR